MIRVGVYSHLVPMLVKSVIVKVCSGGISSTRLISAIRFVCIENQEQMRGYQEKIQFVLEYRKKLGRF